MCKRLPSAGVTSDRWGNFGHFLILLFRVIENIFWHKTYSKYNVDGKYTNLSFTVTKGNQDSTKLKCVLNIRGQTIKSKVFFPLYSYEILDLIEKKCFEKSSRLIFKRPKTEISSSTFFPIY